MKRFIPIALGALLLGLQASVPAQTAAGADYLAQDLLSPCQEADNDSRRWGQAAETECEQYIMGFVAALAQTGGSGPEAGVCPPDVNTADEVRWSFMRWVHGDYTNRRSMPAGEALLASLKAAYPCK